MANLGPFKALGTVMQLAYLPDDFDAAVKHWTEVVGVGPFFLLPNIQLGDMKYRGQPTDAMFSVAIAYWGDLQIELIRPENDGPSIYNGEYAVKDRLHHVCIVVDDLTAARAACAEAGAEILVEGKVGDTGEVIYVDAGGGPGNVLEFVKLMTGGDDLFAMMRDAARNWDGTDPLRTIG